MITTDEVDEIENRWLANNLTRKEMFRDVVVLIRELRAILNQQATADSAIRGLVEPRIDTRYRNLEAGFEHDLRMTCRRCFYGDGLARCDGLGRNDR